MTKALGMRVYFNFNPIPTLYPNNPFENCWEEVCATAVDGGGVEANIEDLEPCLKDLLIVQFPGDVKYSEQTIDYKIDYGDPATDLTTVTTNVYSFLENCCINRRVIAYCIEIPTAPASVYASRTAYVASQTDMSKERNQDMKAQVTLIPTPVPTTGSEPGSQPVGTDGSFLYSLNAPTPICDAEEE